MNNGQRENLSSNLVKHVRFHFGKLSQADLSAYTVERQKSSYPKAKADLKIFDAEGNAVFEGREFGGGQTSLWTSQ